MTLLPADDHHSEYTVEVRDASPSHLLVKINSFSLLSENGIKRYETGEFSAGDYEWRLVIYPDGDKIENEGDHVSVYLAMVKTASLPVDWEVNAVFSIFLFNQISDSYLCFCGKMRRFHAIKSEWGFHKLISKKALTDPSNGYLVDDNCVFSAEVFVLKSERVIEQLSVLKITNSCNLDRMICLSLLIAIGDCWMTREFTAGGHRWKIGLDTNGGQSRCASIYLYSVDAKSFSPHEQVKADFTLRIKNQLNDDHRCVNSSQWFSSSRKVWGSSEFVSMVDLRDPSKGLSVDDCIILEVEISILATVSGGDAL